MLEPKLCSSRILLPFREESGDEELSVLPRHTKVIVTGNNRTKSVLVGLQRVIKKAVGLGGWHWLILSLSRRFIASTILYQRCSVGLSRIGQEFNLKCIFVLIFSLSEFLPVIFWLLPLHSSLSGFDAKYAISTVDVAAKILSFSQKGPPGICVLSANGTVSNVTIRQPDSSGGVLTYEVSQPATVPPSSTVESMMS